MPIAEHRLKRRGQSLADAGLKLRIERPTGQPDRMLVTRDFRDDKRTVGVRLTFVSGGHCVLAREVPLIRGDKPMNASEAQMRSGPRQRDGTHPDADLIRSEEHTSELQSLMRISYAVFCLKKKKKKQ